MADLIPDILMKAAEVIETRGWHQGYYMPAGTSRATCPVCVLGAINVAAGYPPDGSPDERTDVAGPAEDATKALIEHLGGLHADTWNDALGRTAEQVTTALRECAASLKAGA